MQAAAGGRSSGRPSGRSSWLPVAAAAVLLLLGAPAVCIHMETTESHSEFSCEPIRLRMCQDLPYNTTFMPNLLNHYDQQTAALAMEVSPLHANTRACVHVDLEKCIFFYFCVQKKAGLKVTLREIVAVECE